ncbi:helix-turn-helix domain-containing protein [Streptomyces sp. ID05-04B]|uniref:helix-turn-helix domain-containing protein n=1 Tax=Streptomyces sp. P3 TaxID=2135430 RepID=UPI0026593A2C|nr:MULTISPECIES: helix-turn-helix domain-containing protein [unclassified Streptomyces]MDX5569762.1 helix-turn-helix domain-containing protein [Streptomyces sp. ID05-04B]
MAEHRYRAVLQVMDGAPVSQVARQFGASRQSVYAWVERYHVGRLDALVDKSRPAFRAIQGPTRVTTSAGPCRWTQPSAGLTSMPPEPGKGGQHWTGPNPTITVSDAHAKA